ncbi:MAG: methyltransferase [Saprospiraceae bacterium]|nr:methyltransferase [Lewinella sp.]
MKRIDFLVEGLKDLKTVGTITRSSRYLCKNMIKHINFQEADLIVELGAGDGVITRFILEKMKPNAKLLVFEVNPKFCEILRNIGDDRLIVAEDSAEELANYMQRLKANKVDYVVSALPFVALPKELGLDIVSKCHQFMKQGGRYVQVHYSLLTKKLYQSVFGNVDVNFVPLNVPPAFVLVSEKK